MAPSADLAARVAASFRDDAGRAVAALARALGDVDAAEDAIQDAYLVAIERWPRDGFPDRPSAWIFTTARNRAIDRLRRDRTGRAKLERLAALEAVGPPPADDAAVTSAPELDDRLGLIFACCHPALDAEARIALTLRTLCGLTTEEIADAFLVPRATMAQRLVRVKRKIRAAAIPFGVPPASELPERIDDVCTVVYLVFNEGYAATSGDVLVRRDLCNEAIRLARLLVRLLPVQAEVVGLLALLLFADSRREARTAPDGSLIRLADQDRRRWDRAAIAEANGLLGRANRSPLGPYALEAAIAAVHANAPDAEAVDWPLIVRLYDRLARLAPSPVVGLNRAVAIAEADGPAAGLAALDALDARELADYHLFHAARAELFTRLGRTGEARDALDAALARVRTPHERALLATRRAGLGVDSDSSRSSEG